MHKGCILSITVYKMYAYQFLSLLAGFCSPVSQNKINGKLPSSLGREYLFDTSLDGRRAAVIWGKLSCFILAYVQVKVYFLRDTGVYRLPKGKHWFPSEILHVNLILFEQQWTFSVFPSPHLNTRGSWENSRQLCKPETGKKSSIAFIKYFAKIIRQMTGVLVLD